MPNKANGQFIGIQTEQVSDSRWSVPGKRAKGYAEERKAKVHKWGDKEGQELTPYEAGMRSGYLQCQKITAGCSNTVRHATRVFLKGKPVRCRKDRGRRSRRKLRMQRKIEEAGKQ